MPKITTNLDADANKAAIKESTRLGMSKQHYIERITRAFMIRAGLIKQTPTDKELGVGK